MVTMYLRNCLLFNYSGFPGAMWGSEYIDPNGGVL